MTYHSDEPEKTEHASDAERSALRKVDKLSSTFELGVRMPATQRLRSTLNLVASWSLGMIHDPSASQMLQQWRIYTQRFKVGVTIVQCYDLV